MDDIQLVKDAKQGSREALNMLLTQNYSVLKGYALKMSGDLSLAQDITQEAMLRAVLHIKDFNPGAKFSTYLITIATNVYRDILRKNSHIMPLDEELESAGEGPEDLSISNIEVKEVLEILSSVPYQRRAAFILKHYYGYPYEEISKILKCPVGTVRSGLHYCIKYIRDEMKRRNLI